jgi:hypothetical protein
LGRLRLIPNDLRHDVASARRGQGDRFSRRRRPVADAGGLPPHEPRDLVSDQVQGYGLSGPFPGASGHARAQSDHRVVQRAADDVRAGRPPRPQDDLVGTDSHRFHAAILPGHA